jgi:aspartate-semialdehyde dehydrogenase
MPGKSYRIGIAGATSLAGKELNEVLGDSALASSDFVLMDEVEAIGQLEAVGDEITFVQPLDANSFRGMDFVFFAGQPEAAKKYWRQAARDGASIVDLTYALETEPGVLVRAPWVTEVLGGETARSGNGKPAHISAPDLKTPAVIAAHPAALMLALVVARLHKSLQLRQVAATVLEPASQYGRAAMDELHQQTVNLLSFQPLPKEQYDVQVAFNLTPALGDVAKVNLPGTDQRIREHYAALSAGRLPELALQLVQAPAFHGYVASLMVELAAPAAVEQVETALEGEHVEVVLGEADAPSNLTSAGQEEVLVRLRPEPANSMETTRFWLWLANDNLKLAALNAVACAQELSRLRPQGKVQ